MYADKTLFLKFFGNVNRTPNFTLKYDKYLMHSKSLNKSLKLKYIKYAYRTTYTKSVSLYKIATMNQISRSLSM